MRWLPFVLGLATLPAGGQAQQFEVAGTVVDAVTGGPLAHAGVAIEPLPEARAGGQREAGTGASPTAQADAMTGTDGSFRFRGIPAGRYALRASRRGYIAASLEQHGDFFAALVVGGGSSEAAHLRFPLLPLATIEGSVLDSSGDPVQTASVSLFMQSQDGLGRIQLRQTVPLEPGSSRFEFDSLAPGTYFAAVTARPWFAENNASDGGAPDPLDVAYPVTFFDSAGSAAAAQPISIKAGDTAQVSFSLHAVPAVHVRVTTPRDGSGFLGLPQLSAPAFSDSLPLLSGMSANRMTRQDGSPTLTTTMSIAPGTYSVQQGSRTSTVNASADTSLSGEPAAPAPVRLTGKVAMADGSALPEGLSLHLAPEPGGGLMQVSFLSQGTNRVRGRAPAFGKRPVEAALDVDGRFSADAVPPGDYRLNVVGPGSDAVMVTGAAATGARLSGELVLHVAADPVMLAATIALANCAVSGRVLAGQAAASGAMVLLVPEDPAAAMLYRQEESDSDGTWTIHGVAPGAYRVIAIRDGWDLAWKQPGVLARYLASSEAVTVPAGGTAALHDPLMEQAR